jgi:D-glycero-D-manno-heptose 1,7-bisphosphate phosphatase
MNLAGVEHLVLDRDGVLNVEAPGGGYVRSPGEWRWIDGALESLAELTRAGLRITVATNQSGVGRGLMTSDDLAAVHAGMLADVERAGGRIDAVLTCCHAPGEGCDCRKPAPGLIKAAVEASGMRPELTLVVGDDVRDIEAARAAGVPAVLVLTGKGRAAVARLGDAAVPTYDDLRALTRALVSAR